MRYLLSSLLMVAGWLGVLLPTVSTKSGPTSVAYVEVNTNAIGNVGRYTLSDGSAAFDLAVIFAANINFNGSAAVLYNNPQVQTLLDNAATEIRPLQAKGIRVLLSILGNHQGAGISNFASQAAASAFAGQVRDAVHRYGLDGVDLDDEYADYGTNGTAQPNRHSIGWLLTALRAELPHKLITFYAIGPAANSISSAPAAIGEKLDFAWNPDYGSYSAPNIPGLNKTRLSAAAVDLSGGAPAQAASFAKRTLKDGYGAYMTYDLTNGNHSAYVSRITQALYGLQATYQ